MNLSPDDRHFVYLMFDAAGEVAYIGATSRFDERMEEYLRRPEFVAWARQEYPTRAEAFAAERAAIRQHKPKWNAQNKGDAA